MDWKYNYESGGVLQMDLSNFIFIRAKHSELCRSCWRYELFFG